MSSATNRTERLAKALMEARPDFTLHNARAFARGVIEAPEAVFGSKPLTIMPREDSSIPGLPRVGEPHDTNNGAVQHVDSGAAFYRPGTVGGMPAPIPPSSAVPGDLVVQQGGTSGQYLGDGRMSPSARETATAIPGPVHDMHPSFVRRPPLPDNKTREQAIESWSATEFALGVDANGTQVCWQQSSAPSLAVVGRPGSGQTVVAKSALDQARAAGWMTLYATTAGDRTVDPKGIPGLVTSSSLVSSIWSREKVNKVSVVIEIAHRILQHRRSAGLPGDAPATQSNGALLDAYGQDVPVLLVLDSIDAYRPAGRPDDNPATVEGVCAVADILTHGFDHRIHVLVTSQVHWPEYLPGLWTRSIPQVVLTGKPDMATTRPLGLNGSLIADIFNTRWQMTLIERMSDDGDRKAFAASPFQGYFGGPELRVVPGQYPRMALDITGIDVVNDVVDFYALTHLPDVLLDRHVNGRWEPDPKNSHLDVWNGRPVAQ